MSFFKRMLGFLGGYAGSDFGRSLTALKVGHRRKMNPGKSNKAKARKKRLRKISRLARKGRRPRRTMRPVAI